MNIGFIGYGNMASAIAKGWINKDKSLSHHIYACAKNYEKLKQNTQSLKIHPCKDAKEVIKECDLIIIAIKPYMVEDVIKPLALLLKDKIVVSVVAGYDFSKYEEILEKGTAHISTIPNTPVAVNEGIIICENTHSLNDEQLHSFKELFSLSGFIEFVDSELLSIAGTMSGCTPAFTAMYIEALGDAGVKYGLSREVSYALASQMLVGTGKLAFETKLHPGMLKDQVCSPKGTTIKGVSSLEKNGFRSAVIQAIDEIEGIPKKS